MDHEDEGEAGGDGVAAGGLKMCCPGDLAVGYEDYTLGMEAATFFECG